MLRWVLGISLALSMLASSALPAPAQSRADIDAQLAAAKTAYQRGDYARAVSLYSSALAALVKVRRVDGAGAVMLNLGRSYIGLEEFPSALTVVRQALAFYRATNDRAGVADALSDEGGIEENLGRPADALVAEKQALAVHRALHARRAQAEDLVKIGFASDDLGRYADALAAYREALVIARQTKDRYVEGVALNDVGTAELQLERYDEALAAFRSALAIAREVEDEIGVAGDLTNIGLVERNAERYSEALKSYAEALALFRKIGDRGGEASALTDTGAVYEGIGRYADALAAHREALALHRALKNRLGEARDLTSIGRVQDDLGDYASALTSHEQALEIDREAANPLGEANALGGLAAVKEHVGRYDDSLADYRRAVEIFVVLGNKTGQATASAQIGNLERELGRYSDALASEERALALALALADRPLEAAVRNYTGSIAYALGRYDDALLSYRESLATARSIRNRQGEAAALANIANVEVEMGLYGDALSSFDAALAIDRAIGSRLGEAQVLDNLGNTQSDLGRSEVALALHRQALAIDREIGNRLGEATNLGNIGKIDVLLGRFEDAVTIEAQALAVDRDISYSPGTAADLTNMGYALASLGRYDDAFARGREAATLESSLADPEGLWRALVVEAHADVGLARRAEALALYDAALDDIEGLRASLEGAERGGFFGNRLFVYDEYVAYLQQLDGQFPGQGYDRKALEIFERKSARAALEQIGDSAARRFKGVDPKVVADEDSAVLTFAAAQIRLRKLSSGSAPSSAALESARQSLAEARASVEAVEAGIKASNPAYYSLRHPRPLVANCAQATCSTIDGFARSTLRSGELLLVYDLLGAHSVLWLVDREGLRAVALPGEREIGDAVARVNVHVAAMQRALQSSNGGVRAAEKLERTAKADLPGFAADSYALYRMLVPETARAALAHARSAIVVPSGALYRLAFETLVSREPEAVGAPHYLIEDVPLSYVPSASLLAVVRGSYGRRSAGRTPLLAFANPDFGASPPSLATGGAKPQAALAGLQFEAVRAAFGDARASGGASAFPVLPGTQTEADAVRAALGADGASVMTGAEASRSRLFDLNARDRLKTYRYILFATHAVLPGEVKGLVQPAIVLAHPELGDGFLTMADVFGLSLDADFVALSACKTGIDVAGAFDDGISGLTRAFLYAGTPAISVTLWEVDDAAAPRITPPFFAAMHDGMSPAQALRRAKLAMLESPQARFRHPFAWGPSVIFGDGDGPDGAADAR